MRGRVGGRIGTSYPPSSYGANGVWSLADVYATLRGSYGGDPYGYGPAWPMNTVSISWPYQYYVGTVDWIDATETGEGTFSPDVQSTYPSLNYSWERSTNGGTTWTTVSGQTSATLTLTGQTTANDEDKYRLVADAGIRKFYGPAGSVRFEPGFVSPVSVQWGGGLDAGSGFTNSLTISAGTNFEFQMQGLYQRTKYSGDPVSPSSVVLQSSADGGTTWQSETPSYSYPSYAGKYYTAASGDNGKKWRGVATFLGQTYTSPVATLTVT